MMGQKAFRMMDRMRILLGMLVISSFISIATTSTTAPVAGENATIEYQSMPDESEGSGYVRDTPAPAAAPDSDASDAWQDKSEAISCDSYDAQSCCSKEINKVSDETISIPTKQKSDLPSFTFVTVESSDVSICKKDAKGKDFRGTLSKTKSGKTCQAWGVQTPHEHSRRPTDYPDAGLESNYCRNPDNEAAPWCYTTDSNTRWEYCFIPTCPTTRKVLTFVGQTIYMSQIYNILKDGQYKPSSPMDRKLQYNVNIQSDAFYCDERQKRSDETSQANLREYKIPGLLKFVLTARSIESDNCVLNFNHDGITMKEEFPAQPTKNGENGKSFGANGKNGEDGSVGVNGYDGTEVNIAYLSAKGRLRIQTKGVQGAKGGNGANGGAGFKGKDGSCSYKCKDTQKCYTGYGTYCEDRSSKNCKTEHHNKVAPGTAGNGGKAGAKGKPGNGGAAGTVNLYLKDVSNTGFKLTLSGCKGSVGPNTASDGQGGNGGASGGPGRTRGCAWYKKYRRTGGGWGAAPYDWLCTDRSDKNCPQSRGASGSKGAVKTALQGSVGAKLQGIMTSSKLRFRAYFDDVVQQMVIQHAEDLFIQGKKDEAKEILETALQLMTSANQANIDYCNTLIQFITSGLNYFGYKENQFSAIGWTTTRDEVTALIQTANTQAANINNILKYIATKDVLKSNRDLFATSMLAPAQSELLETGRRILFEQNLKKKAIEIMGEMEDHMDVLADKMKQDLEKAVNRRKVKFALELVQLGLSLFAGFLSFKSARKSKDKFGAAGAILGGAEQIMTYVTDQSLRASKGRMCNTKYGEMKDFAEKMMKMSVYIPTDPLQTSFLNIDSVAKAELLKVQALEKRDDLLLGFKCLIEFVGYPGDVLEGTIGAYFDYSFARLNVMGQAIQHDINIKQLQFKKERIEATIKSLTEATKESNLGTYNPAMEKARLLFKEKMVEVFRGIEKDALRGLYKKSIAFQFITLWDPKLTDAIKLAKSSQRTAVGDVFFTGNLYLQELDNKLKNMECKLRNCMAQSDRYVIRHNAYMWIFTPARQKKLFEGIWTAGIGSFTLTNEGICSNNAECINLRLKKMYVEVRGDGLFKDQNIVRVEVSHSGQNLFYMPSDGATTATYTQTKKKLVHINVDKTKLTTTTCSNDRWYCNAAFPSNGNGRDMCTLAEQAPIEQLYGTEPCRSLFSQYTVNLPKTDTEHGSITKNSNLLDWTKVQSIKVFATVRAFKNYPTESDCAGAGGCGSNKKLKKAKKAKNARKFKKSE